MHTPGTIFTNRNAAGKSFQAHLEPYECARLFEAVEFLYNWHKHSQFRADFFRN